MRRDPRQTDLEEFIHDQDAPNFIGPRLPKDHPAYRAPRARQGTASPSTATPTPVKASEGETR